MSRSLVSRSLLLVAVALHASGCGPVRSSFSSGTPYPPRAPGCSLVWLDPAAPASQMHVLATTHRAVGGITLRGSGFDGDARDAVNERACRMGGDTLMASVEPARHEGFLVDEPDLTILVFRAYTAEERAENLRVQLQSMGVGDDVLREKASFDHGCPAARISIVRKREDLGSGDYVLDVCGATQKYVRQGTVYAPVSPPAAAPVESR